MTSFIYLFKHANGGGAHTHTRKHNISTSIYMYRDTHTYIRAYMLAYTVISKGQTALGVANLPPASSGSRYPTLAASLCCLEGSTLEGLDPTQM